MYHCSVAGAVVAVTPCIGALAMVLNHCGLTGAVVPPNPILVVVEYFGAGMVVLKAGQVSLSQAAKAFAILISCVGQAIAFVTSGITSIAVCVGQVATSTTETIASVASLLQKTATFAITVVLSMMLWVGRLILSGASSAIVIPLACIGQAMILLARVVTTMVVCGQGAMSATNDVIVSFINQVCMSVSMRKAWLYCKSRMPNHKAHPMYSGQALCNNEVTEAVTDQAQAHVKTATDQVVTTTASEQNQAMQRVPKVRWAEDLSEVQQYQEGSNNNWWKYENRAPIRLIIPATGSILRKRGGGPINHKLLQLEDKNAEEFGFMEANPQCLQKYSWDSPLPCFADHPTICKMKWSRQVLQDLWKPKKLDMVHEVPHYLRLKTTFDTLDVITATQGHHLLR